MVGTCSKGIEVGEIATTIKIGPSSRTNKGDATVIEGAINIIVGGVDNHQLIIHKESTTDERI